MDGSVTYRWLWAAFALALVACQDATQARVRVHTDVAYDSALRLGMWTRADPKGAPSLVETVPWSDDGVVGSLVVVPPKGLTDAALAVRVVLSRNRAPEECSAADMRDCIVSTRKVSFQPHESLQIPIGLYARCLGVSCADGETCNYLGQCVSETLDGSACRSDTGCVLPGDPPSPPGVKQIAAVDAGTADAPVPVLELPLPPAITFRDQDPAPGTVTGALTWTPSPSVGVLGYEVFHLDPKTNTRVPIANVAAAGPLQYLFLPGTRVPLAYESLGVVAVRGAVRSSPALTRADNYPRVVDIGAGHGIDIANDHGALFDEQRQQYFIAGRAGSQLSLRVCAADGSACKMRVAGEGVVDSMGSARAQLAPAGSHFYIPTGFELGGEGHFRLTRCPLDDGPCTERDLFDVVGNIQSRSTATVADPTNGDALVFTKDSNAPFAVRLARCAGPLNCTVQTVRASSSYGPGLRAVVDQPGGQVFLFTTVDNSDLLVTRCPLGAGACVDTANMPGSSDSLFYGSVARDPLQGDLYVANDWGAGVAVVRCNAAGANCVSLAFPAATTKLASEFASIGFVIDNHRRRIVLMSSRATDYTPLLLDCSMDLASCDVHDIAGQPPFALSQGQLSVRPGNVDVIGRRADGRLVMFRCAVPSFACAEVDLSLEALRGNTMGLGAIVVDEPAKAMMVVTSDPSYESRNSLFRCQLDGTSCTHTFMGTNQVPNEGTWPAAFLDRETGNLLTSFLSTDRSRRSHPALLRCGVDGKNCANVDLSQGLSGFDRNFPWTAAFDTTAKRILVLGTLWRRDSLGISTDSAVLWRCNRDGNACTAGDLGSLMSRGVALFYDGVRNRTVMVGANSGRAPAFCDCESDGSRCSCRDMPSDIFDISTYDPQQGILYAIGLTYAVDGYVTPSAMRCSVSNLQCTYRALTGDSIRNLFGVGITSDPVRKATYFALGDYERQETVLFRCDASLVRCDRLERTPRWSLSRRITMIADQVSGQLMVVGPGVTNNGRPLAMFLDLY